MSNEVYANGRELSCKAGAGKSICAFPDVCLTPPPPPAGPIPIPYPNTGMTSDTSDGSKTVQISGQEVMMKDSSSFKQSTGDEAATKGQGMSVITHQIQGKCYFTSWSMDVKIEGENAVRHLDMMTHNHACGPGGTPPWPFMDANAMNDADHACAKPNGGEKAKVEKACPPPKTPPDWAPKRTQASDLGPQHNTTPECCEARKCMLVPYSPKGSCSKCSKSGTKKNKKKTPHHLVPVADLSSKRPKGPAGYSGRGKPKKKTYKHSKAPCMCLDGKDHDQREGPTKKLMQHGRVGRDYVIKRDAMLGDRGSFSYNEVNDIAAEAGAAETGCNKECLKAQLDAGHIDQAKINPDAKSMRRGETKAPPLEKKPANPNAA